MLAQCRSKAAAGTYDQMTYLEFSPEFTQVDYIKALENKLGKGCVVQIGKASGQILVGFERPDMAETIIEDGLMIKGALLKALPYQKKAEKITISGLPFVIEDADIIRTLRPYCQVVSIAPTVNSSGGYTWLDLKKTAFILMNNGKKITDLPKKIIVTAKGGSALAYLEYGFRCSKCYRMGHKRMNCPRIIRETSTTQPLSQTSSVKTTAPAPNTTAAASPPATFSHPAPVAAPAQTSSAPPAQEDIALETEPTTRTPETSTQTDLNINRVENSSHHKIKDRSRSLSPKAGFTTQLQLDTLLERLPGSFFEEVTLLGLKEEEVKQAIVSLPHLRLLLGKLSVEQSLGLHTFNEKLIKGLGSSKSIELCCFLKQHAVDIAFIQETNVTTLDSVEDLCLGYRAAVVPASGARGSGLACIFSSGVQVIGQQVLSPGKIAAFDVTIRGSKATFVNCHLSHAPDERLQQLQVIAAAAVNEDAWVLGDLNISEESASDIVSGSVEALGELLDRANLVDAAAIFDATHLPTRISSCGSRVDASRLDRVLIPSSFSNRVTRYWSLYYKNSDHRAVLLRTGEASEPRPPCIASMLRSRLVVGTVETLLDEALGNIEDMRNAEIWRRWGHIKAHLASAIKSLHDLRNNDDDYISRARKYVQAKLEDVSIYSDYPSLSDLGRALRLRRRGTSSNTFYDSAGRMITGPAVRELAFVNLKERFSHPSCSPEDIDGFLRGFTLRVTIEESDPLHRYGIGEEEIVAAIGRLPTGKAAGWDDLPCELFRGFEDYFASALRRVFEASQLCGALPTSMRRSEMSLIEKPHGGPGLAGLRPLSLPTTDYRVLSGVLYWRLRPHLRDIVPECQSYAVPGRTPAWNIARVADEVATACRDEAPLAVVAIDLESAFDTLDRGFLVSTLLSVGLPPVFVGWVLLLYAGAEAAARIEGIGRTPLFHMLNGVRQGCAASAAFFTISTGPLLLRLEQLLGRDNVLAYADDIVLLIREDGQLEVVRKIFEDFRRASGIRVNFGKSQGLWCGRWRNRTDSPSAISWNREKINILGTLVTPGLGTSAQDQHLQELLERAIARWSPFVRGLSLAGRAKAANSLVLSAIYYHLQAYLPSETTIGRLQARLARFVWGHDRTSWLPSSILARPISVGGMGLLDVGTQLRLSCLKGVQAALRGGRNAHSWLAESGMWLTPASTPGIWLPPRRRRSLHLFEPAAEILDLNHRILQPALLRALRVVGDCRFLRPPELLAPTRWLGWRIGELTGPAPNITIATRGALTDVAALGSFCTRLITQNARGRYRVDSLADAIVVRGSTTAFQRLTTRTARRLLERPRLAALPITQLFGRWFPHVSIPISISCTSGFSPESCIACGSGDLSLAHRYWSCSRIRPVILEAFTILQRPPDLQSWIFGHDLEDDALAIMASAKTRIYKYFLGLEMRGVQEDPLLVWRRTLSRRKRPVDSEAAGRKAKRGCVQAAAAKQVLTERPMPKSRDADLVAALRSYGQVTSVVQKMMEMGDSSWADARRYVFITLKDRVKLSQIPARLDIKSKGIATHVYVTYGIKCSLCNRQASHPQVERLSSSSTGLSTPPSKKQDKPKASESSQERRTMAEIQMDVLLKNDKASTIIDSAQKISMERGHLLQALTHNGKMNRLLAQSNAEQKVAIDTLATALMALTGNTSDTLYKKLSRARNCSAAEMRFRVATLNTGGTCPPGDTSVTTGGDAGFDPIPFNPSLNIRKYAGDEDPRQWITSLEEVGFLYRWADYIITRYAAMNLVGPAKTWYEFHKVNLATWEIFKTRLIQDFASLENKDEMMLKLNRMQGENLAEPASLNWADSEMAEVDANDDYTVVKSKKRRLSSTPEHAAKQASRPAEKRGPQQQKRTTGPRSMPPQEIKATRANIADARARQATTNHENYVFVELCPDIPDYSYLKAMSTLLGGPKSITQFHRMNGHFIVGLADKELANRLVADGLEIEGTSLRVFPFRKRAERIVVANLPGFVEDSTITTALGQFEKVTSIAPILVKMGEFTFTDGRREAFILLREGGDTLSAFISFGIKCFKCGKQGHRRANCPALARQGNGSPRQAASPTDARPQLPPPRRPRKPAPAPATPASPVQPAKTSAEAQAIPSAHQPAEQMDLTHPAPAADPPLAALRPPEPRIPPLDNEMSVEKLSSPPATPARGKATLEQLLEHLGKSPNPSIDWDKLPDLNCEEAQKLLTSETTMKRRAPTLTKEQFTALEKLHETIMALCPDSNSTIRKTLQKTRKETNAFHLGSGQDLCLGYGAVVLAHPVAISGSGLACVFGPGVATTADRGPSSSSSSDALAALLDLAALVDVATQFDAAHLPTRVSMHGDQVESNRLDRILVPAGVLDRVSIYATSHYHLSDHRLVLLQVGPPTTAVSSPTQPRLAAMLRSGLALEHLAGYIRELEEDTAHDDDDGTFWDRWTSIKAGLLAEARSLHDPRHAANDSYVYRARRYIAAQLEASSIRADYPSLPDLARAIRLRRPVSVIRDGQDNIIEGPELRRRAFATFQPRFARPTSDPAKGAAFIASSAPTTTTRELSEEDPLLRPDISPSEIANAIEHLPRGKAPGWDGLPCELLVAFSEDFFAEALARVFAASRLRGALPPSTRRSSICLVPKARGGSRP
ncbi:hypothetical protein LAZ67_5002189 [Cordylochernes scorpioides]|uniref:Reverse transcriptase domain-containing protein n=1 Tax=Cordylochernes scorpioides TaxID=51811 RepID=A0ABY6KG65_9ARAC|nr:hypothetical protein LAZ67_5002189 [Cordylochernes scorpioides]